MSVTAASLRQSGRYRALSFNSQQTLQPKHLTELVRILDHESPHMPPFRPSGAGSAATDCNTSSVGTVIDMTAFDGISDIDAYKGQITVQAGARLSAVSDALAVHGMELEGSHDLMNRTVGGAVAGGCIGPSLGDDAALFASQVIGMKVVTPGGKLLDIQGSQKNLLNVFRLSYGMLGVIYEVTLRARPITGFSATHRRCSIEQFSNAVEKLADTSIGLKFFMLPFLDRVYLDLRRFDASARATARMPWKVKDWGESTVLPSLFKSLNRIIPVSGVRYRMIDEVSRITQGIVSSRLVSSGSISTAQSGAGAGPRLNYSTWFFPAAEFPLVVPAYRDLCLTVRKDSGFRCDMPTVGYRLPQDGSALLSPSHDGPMFALRAVSTQTRGWDDFAIDLGDFARKWGGTPLFNQTRELSPAHAGEIFGNRLEYFRRARRRIDPDNRMMNPFLSQYFL